MVLYKFKINYGWFLNLFKVYVENVINLYIEIYKIVWNKNLFEVVFSVNVVSGIDYELLMRNYNLFVFYCFFVDFNNFVYYFLYSVFEKFVFSEE